VGVRGDFIYSPTLTLIGGVMATVIFGMLLYVLPLAVPHGPELD
jgi:hypothetical protein